MYIAALVLAIIVLIAVYMAYPFFPNHSRVSQHDNPPNHDRPLDGDDGKVKNEDVVLPSRNGIFPDVVPMIDITQPLLDPKMPITTSNKVPEIPKSTTDPAEILAHPSLLVEWPPRSHLDSLHPQAALKAHRYGSARGSPFGKTVVNITLPTYRNLCWKFGEVRPPTYHIKGHSSLHGTNFVQAAVDPNGDVIPHVYITAWDKNTGDVTLRNDYSNWRGDIDLGYYLECNYPENFNDTRNVVKQMSYKVTI